MGTKIIFYCSTITQAAIKKAFAQQKTDILATYTDFLEWDDFPRLLQGLGREDCFVLVSSRSGGLSHNRHLDKAPAKLAKHFHASNFVVIYPEQDHTIFNR